MRLLDLVEEHDAVRAAPNGFGQHAAALVPDVAGRRALERGDRVRLLELAHVDGDDVIFAAVERFGQRERGLGLADAGGTHQQEYADGPAGIVQPSAGGLDPAGDRLEAVTLPDDALAERVDELEDGLDLVLHHAADGDACPVRDDGGDGLRVDARQDQRALALHLGELRLVLTQLGES